MLQQIQLSWLTYLRRVRIYLQKAVIKVQSALVRDDTAKNYFCPCCGKSWVRFADWSSTYANTVCPNCDSQPRHRALSIYLDKYGNLTSGKYNFLHFAPESSLRQRFSSLPNLEYTTADLNNPAVDVKIDITQIPYPDNTFDIIFCNHVLEHVPDDRQAMRELFRVLKPGGWASLQVPLSRKIEQTFEDPAIVSPQERLHHFGQEDHVRLYGLDYQERLEEVGFAVDREDIGQILPEDLIRKYGLTQKEELYFGRKPIVG